MVETTGVYFVVQAISVLTFCFLHGHKLPWERGFISSHHFSEVSAFQQTWKSLGRFLSASIESQKLSAQNNPYPEVAYFRVACFDPLDTTLWGKESGILRGFGWHVLGEWGHWPHKGGLSWEARARRGQNKQIALLPSPQSEALFLSTVILRNPKYSKNTSAEQTGIALPGSSWSQCGNIAHNPSFSQVFLLDLRLPLPVSCIKHQNWFLAFNSVV